VFKPKRSRALVALGAVLLTVASGCSGGSTPAEGSTTLAPATRDELITAAKAEGELTWYSTEAVAINDAAIAGFQAKYGIKVTVLRLASTDLLPRYAAERQAGQATADVFTYGSPEPFVQNKEWFVKLGPDAVPALSEFPTGPGGWDETNVLLNVTPNVIAYNTNLVKDPPKSWQDIIDPKYKDNVVLTSPNGGRTYMGWANVVSQKYGIDFLKSLAAQNLKIAPTGGPGAQQVAAGGAAISAPNATTLVQPLVNQGAPIKFVIPNDPSTGSDLRANITSNAKHPNAARLFLDYRLSQESQEAVCKAALNAVASPRSDTQSCIKLSPDFKFIDYFALTNDVESQILDALGLPAK